MKEAYVDKLNNDGCLKKTQAYFPYIKMQSVHIPSKIKDKEIKNKLEIL